jgi:hypothetical protein
LVVPSRSGKVDSCRWRFQGGLVFPVDESHPRHQSYFFLDTILPARENSALGNAAIRTDLRTLRGSRSTLMRYRRIASASQYDISPSLESAGASEFRVVRADMLIPIPIGTKHIASVQGAVWKFVSCAHCQEGYAYLIRLDATGEDHDLLFLDGAGSAERAQAKAEENLLQKSRNVVVPVPCPTCGWYQDDMSRKMKEDASINPVQIAGLVLAMISLVPLAFAIPYRWVLTVALATAGLAVVAWDTCSRCASTLTLAIRSRGRRLGAGMLCGASNWRNWSLRTGLLNRYLHQTTGAIRRFQISMSHRPLRQLS